MKPGMIYELILNTTTDADVITLTNPHERRIKRFPNNMDVIKRAFASLSTDVSMNTSVFDVTSISFSMRVRAYDMAQSFANTTRKA